MGQTSPAHWLIAVFIIVPSLVLLIVPAWRILQRAGFSGAWSLLMPVPLVGLLVLWVLAFVRWPNDNRERTRTSKPWIVAGFVMLPLCMVVVALMSAIGVQQEAAVEQRDRPAQQMTQPGNARGADLEKGVMTSPTNKH